jgi:hypothetical protein
VTSPTFARAKFGLAALMTIAWPAELKLLAENHEPEKCREEFRSQKARKRTAGLQHSNLNRGSKAIGPVPGFMVSCSNILSEEPGGRASVAAVPKTSLALQAWTPAATTRICCLRFPNAEEYRGTGHCRRFAFTRTKSFAPSRTQSTELATPRQMSHSRSVSPTVENAFCRKGM